MNKAFLGGYKTNERLLINEVSSELKKDLGRSLSKKEREKLADSILGDIEDGRPYPLRRLLWEQREKNKHKPKKKS